MASDFGSPFATREVKKAEFKRLFLRYGSETDGWGSAYWDRVLAHETGKRYFFTPLASPDACRMFLSSDGKNHRIFFLSEDAEDAFFGGSCVSAPSGI